MSNLRTRRDMLRTLGASASGATFATSLFAQGRCKNGYNTPACPMSKEVATAPIKPVFPSTGWKTAALEQISFQVPDYRKEAAFYIALLGWKLRSDDGKQAVLDIGDWGSAIFKAAPEQKTVLVDGFGFAIQPWNTKKVKAELSKRNLDPIADDDGKGFESFHVKDPDGFDLQIGNSNGLVKARRTPATAKLEVELPFEATNWQTVWLDHFSFGATNYKASVSYYTDLLGWEGTFDEGSQNEVLMGNIGDAIIRGGNPNDPNFGKPPANGRAPRPRNIRIDHISFGIQPFDADAVKDGLEKRGLRAQIDTGNTGDIHDTAYKSYHTRTPNGYNLQVSCITKETRLVGSTSMKPKA
ncbi:MAG TPA: glyoxalase [Bryobacteraceae bacterium]|jgi:catechol 2,3-dioxygenase-like lactoylglutathione lyase family enzyme|nr:glyoxalase [Bryobacteraceae bacterium]